MDEIRVRGVIKSTDEILSSFLGDLRDYSGGIRSGVRDECVLIREEVSLNICTLELHLVRTTVVLSQNAEYRILKAYFHASPGLMAFLSTLFYVVSFLVEALKWTNELLKAITGENLIFYVESLFPGFNQWWKNMMTRISEVSGLMGWGLDGANHIMNAFNAGVETWGLLKGKNRLTVKMEKAYLIQQFTNNMRVQFLHWEDKPGEVIDWFVDKCNTRNFDETAPAMQGLLDKVSTFGDKAEQALTGLGTISTELLSIRNDMPAVIAKNIPPGIWNALELADTAINDRILPALTDITDRIEELDAVLEAYQKKAAELAERLAHPGDLLAEIDKLPGYARNDQLVKIDGVTSALLKESNEAEFAAVSADLAHFGLVAAALQNPPPPLAFMELELPGRSPGIVAEPYETWFVGEY